MNTAKIKALLIDALQLFAKEGEPMSDVDMSYFSTASVMARAYEAALESLPYLNEVERKSYLSSIENYKQQKLKDPNAMIPDPPMAWQVVADNARYMVYCARTTTPVCEKYVDPDSLPKPEKAGVILPPFAPGRYLAILGDNAPAGYRITLADGTAVEKVLTPWFAGVSVEYRKVQ